VVIVDASNVAHARGDGGRSDAPLRLLELVIASRYAQRGVVLVCDGTPGRLSPGAQASLVRLMASHGGGGCRLVHAGPDREADDVIESMIAGARDPAHLTVVSSDARLRDAAFRAAAPWLSADEFNAHLDKDRDKARSRLSPGDAALDPGSVAWWMRYFGFAGDVPPPAPAPPRSAKVTRRPADAPRPASPVTPVAPTDDWMHEAARMWPGMFAPEDLDMEKWLALDPVKKRRRKRS
jgi:hypothetical protein